MKQFIDGEGISISYVGGSLMITNTMPNRNTFKTIKVLNSELVATHPTDTLTISSDNNINVDIKHDQLCFSLNSDQITSNIKNNSVSSEVFSIRGAVEQLNAEYSAVLTAYHKMIGSAVILRTEISRLKTSEETINQAIELEASLLNYDIELSKMQKQLDHLSKSVQDSEARFTYDAVARTVVVDKALSAPFILENLTTEARNRMLSPLSGRVIFNLTSKKVQVFTGQEWVDLH